MKSFIWLVVVGLVYFEGAFRYHRFHSATAAGWRPPTDAASLSRCDSPSRWFLSSFPLFCSWPQCTVPAPRRQTGRIGWRWPRPRPSPRPPCPWWPAAHTPWSLSLPVCMSHTDSVQTHHRRFPLAPARCRRSPPLRQSAHSAPFRNRKQEVRPNTSERRNPNESLSRTSWRSSARMYKKCCFASTQTANRLCFILYCLLMQWTQPNPLYLCSFFIQSKNMLL